ncbi:MAG: PDZ domain-containing protein [Candidatus Tectomicrobia bacterium]|nr:PDZ domain-containing protein [Candidatus Tectomicrobia bacterium]
MTAQHPSKWGAARGMTASPLPCEAPARGGGAWWGLLAFVLAGLLSLFAAGGLPGRSEAGDLASRWQARYARYLHLDAPRLAGLRPPYRSRAWLGVMIETAPLPDSAAQAGSAEAEVDAPPQGDGRPQLSAQGTRPAERYVRITNVLRGSPAERAGLEAGDMILSFAGETTAHGEETLDRFLDRARRQEPEVDVPLRILRRGEERTVRVRLATWPTRRGPEAPHPELDLPASAPPSTLEEAARDDVRGRRLAMAMAYLEEAAQRRWPSPAEEGLDADPFRLPEVTYLLRHPFATLPVAAQLVERIGLGAPADDAAAGAAQAQRPSAERPHPGASGASPAHPLGSVVERLRGAAAALHLGRLEAPAPPLDLGVRALIARWLAAQEAVQRSLARLTDEDRQFLWQAISRSSPLRLEAAEWSRLLRLATTIDLTPFVQAALDLAVFFEPQRRAALRAALRAWTPSAPAPAVEGVSGRLLLAEETPAGLVLVGDEGPNLYRRDAAFILDLGGDDVYLNNAGASRPGMPVTMVVDLDGDDLYGAARGGGEEGPAQGAGCLGVGLLIDLAGNDRYIGGRLAQGAGCLGVGLLLDAAGDDTYEGNEFVQGYGLFGIGMLIDEGGWDAYRAAGFAQGASMTGGLGALVEMAGNDVYVAGGRDADFRDPAKATTSFSQGFSIGARPRGEHPGAAGGIGLLADFSGHDTYVADYFGQGASYWYGLGILYDGAGNDRYLAGRYAQGAGVHFSLGALLDEGGDDRYEARVGVSQGLGHDQAFGLLADAEGEDVYQAGWLAQGAGSANGVGLLLDLGGKDQALIGERGLGWGEAPAAGASAGIVLKIGGGLAGQRGAGPGELEPLKEAGMPPQGQERGRFGILIQR